MSNTTENQNGKSLVINVVLPVIAYIYATNQGYSPVIAFSVATVFPFAATLWSIVKTRHVDGIALFVLITLVANIGVAYISNSTRIVFEETAVVTVILGVVCFGSILVKRPLLFYFSRSFNAGNDERKIER